MVEQVQRQPFNGLTVAGTVVQWLKVCCGAVQPLQGCGHGSTTGLGTDHIKGVGLEALKTAPDGAEPHTSPPTDMATL